MEIRINKIYLNDWCIRWTIECNYILCGVKLFETYELGIIFNFMLGSLNDDESDKLT